MAGDRYAPRKMDLAELIGVLEEEHRTMRRGLARVRDTASKGDYGEASVALRQLDSTFKQHIADEESSILRLLIDELGAKGAEREIRVFQQHRPIHKLMQTVGELASKSARELGTEQGKLESLFTEHTILEEENVFPRALGIFKGRSQQHQSQ